MISSMVNNFHHSLKLGYGKLVYNINVLYTKIKDDKILLVLLAILSYYAGKGLFAYLRNLLKKKQRGKEAEEIRTRRDQKLIKFLENNIEPVNNIEIVKSDACELIKKIRSGEFRILDVYLGFSVRSAKLGHRYGWIADVCLQEGLEQAKVYQEIYEEKKNSNTLDELFKEKPLLGLPISVKDCMPVKGMTCTIGFTAFGNKKYDYDCEVVRVLREKGAIPFVHSTVPQGMLTIDSSTYLWGRCDNAWNQSKIAGGSSGGEGGLIAAYCSPLGLGSDIGGSIRIPSILNGIYGFKPSSCRISKQGGVTYNGTSFVGFNYINSSWGPMCRSVRDVAMITKELFGCFENDPTLINQKCNIKNNTFIYKKGDPENLSKNDDIFSKKIKIGYFYHTKMTESSNSVMRAVLDVKEKLSQKEYEFKEFDSTKIDELVDIGFCLLTNSGAAEIIPEKLDGEPLYYYYQKSMMLRSLPRILRLSLSFVLRLFREKRASSFVYDLKNLNKNDYLKLASKYLKLKDEFIEYWKAENFDALICPVLPVTSVSHGTADTYHTFNQFNFIANMIDLPACTIPMYLNDDTSFESKYNDQISKIFKKEAETSKGMPVGIQVIGSHMQDEFLLKLVEEISSHYKFEDKFGTTILQ